MFFLNIIILTTPHRIRIVWNEQILVKHSVCVVCPYIPLPNEVVRSTGRQRPIHAWYRVEGCGGPIAPALSHPFPGQPNPKGTKGQAESSKPLFILNIQFLSVFLFFFSLFKLFFLFYTRWNPKLVLLLPPTWVFSTSEWFVVFNINSHKPTRPRVTTTPLK